MIGNKYYVNLTKKRGFTLLELILGCTITGIIITLAGSFLIIIMNANQQAEAEINNRHDLERAIDFMADEVRIAESIETNKLRKQDIPSLKTATGSQQQTPILVIYPSQRTGLVEPIVYYIAKPPKNSVWNGPLVIYRWGPTLRQAGCYSDGKIKKSGTDICAVDDDSKFKYYNEMYVDGINPSQTKNNPKCSTYQNINIPPINDRRGFYLCLSPEGKSVNISLEKSSLHYGKSIVVSRTITSRIK